MTIWMACKIVTCKESLNEQCWCTVTDMLKHRLENSMMQIEFVATTMVKLLIKLGDMKVRCMHFLWDKYAILWKFQDSSRSICSTYIYASLWVRGSSWQSGCYSQDSGFYKLHAVSKLYVSSYCVSYHRSFLVLSYHVWCCHGGYQGYCCELFVDNWPL